jgi:hypothetical protein
MAKHANLSCSLVFSLLYETDRAHEGPRRSPRRFADEDMAGQFPAANQHW